MIPEHFHDGEALLAGENMVIWLGVSDVAIAAINKLKADGRVIAKPAPVLVYAIDGAMLTMPLAKQNRAYRKPHWLPVVLSLPKAAC
jgi:hypothetical protein